MRYKTKIRLIILASVVLLLFTSSCSLIRKTTYPPDFIYLENKTVTSSMQKLAVSIDRIERTISQININPSPTQRNIIVDELKNMERISENLGAGTQSTNHLFIDLYIDHFRSDVIETRQSIETEPSNYYQAGKLVGSCLSCHVMRSDNWIL